jgi:glycosyltransferase involved in cell wall biosynthesis
MSRPRIALFTLEFPYPPMWGGRLRQWQHLTLLAASADIFLYAVLEPHEQVRPEWVSHVARMVQGLHLFRMPLLSLTGTVVNYLHALLFRSQPVVNKIRRAVPVGRLIAKVREHDPHLALISYAYLGFLAGALQRELGCRVVIDAHNVESRVQAQFAMRGRLLYRIRYWIAARATDALERRVYPQADEVWVCSEEDAEVLRRGYDVANARVVPNAVEVDRYLEAGSAREPEPNTIGMFGDFGYFPNAEGARFLLRRVFPYVRRIVPSARLYFVGRRPTREMLAASQRDSSIVVTGQVEDALPWLARCAVIAAPIWSGGGTSFKVLEAMAVGRAVVGTRTAYRGLGATPGLHYLPAETAEEFVEAVLRLLGSAELRQRLVIHGQLLVKDRFSFDAVAWEMRRFLSSVPVRR